MSEVSREKIEAALDQVIDPHLGMSLLAAKVVRDIGLEGGRVIIDLGMPYPCLRWADTLRTMVRDSVQAVPGVTDVTINISQKIIAHSVQHGVKRLENVKNIIAVASGKGGVGKSTTSANLALALASEGASVGLLDADIYGPSQPRMMGLSGQPESLDGKSLEPMENYGVQTMSIGFLIDEETPMIWRGPMVTQALEQLLNDTRWRDLDYLVIDLPPGTGDTQLTLSQKVPVSGAIIVTTPQDIALLDARKGLKMFEKVEIPILGIVENMSTHICSQCGHEEPIFGAGGGQSMATESNVELLGSLPLEMSIRLQADGGKPTVVADPDSRTAESYRVIARKAAARLSRQAKDYSAAFPNIVIQNT
ncbi:MAG: iron-sulfur cluster carrier protein ApbC [Granulosicoccus sp.]|nr:iron-sulfur cluster carrier protein ApbC [Granulosicoccus sp.]